jgi:putative ABC transport system permease protein
LTTVSARREIAHSMTLFTFIVRNMLGRRVRSALTVLGLAVAIAAVILLTGIAHGFERSLIAAYRSRGIDLIVVRAGISDQLSSNLDQKLGDELQKTPGVESVGLSLIDAVSFEEANLASVLANGWEPGGLLIQGLRILDGRALQAGDGRAVILGRILALNLGKKFGDALSIAGEKFRVVGIYESASLFENGGLVMPLAELQSMMGRQGQVTGFVIVAKKDVEIAELVRRIESTNKGVAAMPANNYAQNNLQIRLAHAMAWATTAVALALGSIGLLNTMAMAVFERTNEIGLLRALGWKRKRVVFLLLGEAAALGILGFAAGAILAVAGIRVMMLSPTSRGFIDPRLPPLSFGVGLAMGLGLSVLGGAYPALRASRLNPNEALRHD